MLTNQMIPRDPENEAQMALADKRHAQASLHAAAQRTVRERDVKWLGVAGAYEYGTIKGAEYAVERTAADMEAFTPAAGELLVNRVHFDVLEDGTRMELYGLHRAFEVAPGTFAALTSRRKSKANDGKPRIHNRLAELAFMQRKEPRRMVSGPVSAGAFDKLPTLGASNDEEREAVAALADQVASRPAAIIETGGHEAPATVQEFIAAYRARGVVLKADRRNHLYPEFAADAKLLNYAEREALDNPFIQELVVGELTGHRVPCGLCDQPAELIVVLASFRCAKHAEG